MIKMIRKHKKILNINIEIIFYKNIIYLWNIFDFRNLNKQNSIYKNIDRKIFSKQLQFILDEERRK